MILFSYVDALVLLPHRYVFMCFSVSDGLRGGQSIYVVGDFVALHLTDGICSCSGMITLPYAHLCKPGTSKWFQDFSGLLSWIDQFSLGPNEEGSKRGMTVLEGAGILARGTGSCT